MVARRGEQSSAAAAFLVCAVVVVQAAYQRRLLLVLCPLLPRALPALDAKEDPYQRDDNQADGPVPTVCFVSMWVRVCVCVRVCVSKYGKLLASMNVDPELGDDLTAA